MVGYYDCQLKQFAGKVDDKMKLAALQFYSGALETCNKTESQPKLSFDLLRITKSEGILVIECYIRQPLFTSRS